MGRIKEALGDVDRQQKSVDNVKKAVVGFEQWMKEYNTALYTTDLDREAQRFLKKLKAQTK